MFALDQYIRITAGAVHSRSIAPLPAHLQDRDVEDSRANMQMTPMLANVGFLLCRININDAPSRPSHEAADSGLHRPPEFLPPYSFSTGQVFHPPLAHASFSAKARRTASLFAERHTPNIEDAFSRNYCLQFL